MVISVVVAILLPFSRVSHVTLQTVRSLELDTLLNILLIVVIFTTSLQDLLTLLLKMSL